MLFGMFLMKISKVALLFQMNILNVYGHN